MQRSALCRSRRELSNAYLLATFGFDTAENEPCQVCPLSAYRSPRLRQGKEKKQQIDYIMMRGRISVGKTLEIPEITETTLLPGMLYPSDHFSIGADLFFGE